MAYASRGTSPFRSLCRGFLFRLAVKRRFGGDGLDSRAFRKKEQEGNRMRYYETPREEIDYFREEYEFDTGTTEAL